MLAVAPRQPLLGPQIVESDAAAARQRMVRVDDQIKILGEQWPGIQPVPVTAEFSGDAEFGFAFLQVFADLLAAAAQKAKFQPVELPLDMLKMRNQKRQIDRMGERNPKCADLAALEGRSQHARAAGRVVTLL